MCEVVGTSINETTTAWNNTALLEQPVNVLNRTIQSATNDTSYLMQCFSTNRGLGLKASATVALAPALLLLMLLV